MKNIEPSKLHAFRLRLADGSVVNGPIATPDGFLPKEGGAGRLRLAIVHAEVGIPTGLVEPEPGAAAVTCPITGQYTFIVPLAGAEVIS